MARDTRRVDGDGWICRRRIVRHRAAADPFLAERRLRLAQVVPLGAAASLVAATIFASSVWDASMPASAMGIVGSGAAGTRTSADVAGRAGSAARASFATARHGVRCTGPDTAAHRALALRVQTRVGSALRTAGPRVAFGVEDLATGVTCTARSTRRYDSASIVKAAIVAALLVRRHSAGRSLSASERAWARAAITRSDNAAASALWNRVGGASGMHRFFVRAGMSRTTPGTGGRWGLTQVIAGDELILLRLINSKGLLAAGDRRYLQHLMASVVSWQRWGVPVGAPAKARVGNKNGWLPRATKGWRVHSIGWVRLRGTTYDVVLLSDGNASMSAGIRRLNKVARAVHAALRIGRSSSGGTIDSAG